MDAPLAKGVAKVTPHKGIVLVSGMKRWTIIILHSYRTMEDHYFNRASQWQEEPKGKRSKHWKNRQQQ